MCCRRIGRRRTVFEANHWLDLGPRKARREALREAEWTALERLRGLHLAARHRGRCCAALGERALTARFYWERLALDRLEPRTGLPVRLLEEYCLLSLEHEGPHGMLLKASKDMPDHAEHYDEAQADEGDEPSESQEEVGRGNVERDKVQYFAVRIRNKSMGNVNSMPLYTACRVLRTYAIRGRGFANKMLDMIGLRPPLFQHSALVKQHAVFNTREFLIEVSDWQPGGGLLAELEARGRQLDEHQACEVMTRVLMALQYLHDRQVIHRDVRLSQILLPSEAAFDKAKLGDFWCMARLPRAGGVIIDRSIPMQLLYAAPEVLEDGAWSERSDVWAAGCALFELLHGHPPFGGHGPALLKRIREDEPEFDEAFGSLSASAADLLRSMLAKSPAERPSVSQTLQHRWFQEFGDDELRRRTPDPVMRPLHHSHVKLYGEPPDFRSGMPAENVLSAQEGMFNAGYCTRSGVKSVALDFEIRGLQGESYWVESLLVALWGKDCNPRLLIVRAKVSEEADFAEVIQQHVDSEQTTHLKLLLNIPVRYIRLELHNSFGSLLGIAIRKVVFSGHRVDAMAVTLPLDECRYHRQAALASHAEFLKPEEVEQVDKVHPSMLRRLVPGKRIQGTWLSFKSYRDVTTGLPHESACVELPKFQLLHGSTILGASLEFRYASDPDNIVPTVRVCLVRQRPKKEAAAKKFVLFQLSDLESTEWGPGDILARGYRVHRPVFSSDLKLEHEDNLHVEILIDNKSGTLHFPPDLGLTFYCWTEALANADLAAAAADVAEFDECRVVAAAAAEQGPQQMAGGPRSSNSFVASEEEQRRQSPVPRQSQGQPGQAKPRKSVETLLEDGDEYSEHLESEEGEVELKADMSQMLEKSFYGGGGPKQPVSGDASFWNSIFEASSKNVIKNDLERVEANPWELPDHMAWWKGASTASMSSTTPSDGGGGSPRAAADGDESSDGAGKDAAAAEEQACRASLTGSVEHREKVAAMGLDMVGRASTAFEARRELMLKEGEERMALRKALAVRRQEAREAELVEQRRLAAVAEDGPAAGEAAVADETAAPKMRWVADDAGAPKLRCCSMKNLDASLAVCASAPSRLMPSLPFAACGGCAGGPAPMVCAAPEAVL